MLHGNHLTICFLKYTRLTYFSDEDEEGSNDEIVTSSTSTTTTTTTEAEQIEQGGLCQPVSPYDQVSGMSKWCVDNCVLGNMDNCPKDVCSCT